MAIENSRIGLFDSELETGITAICNNFRGTAAALGAREKLNLRALLDTL